MKHLAAIILALAAVGILGCGSVPEPESPAQRTAASKEPEPVDSGGPPPPPATTNDLTGLAPVTLPVRATVVAPRRAGEIDLAAFVPARARVRRVWFLGEGASETVLVEWVPRGAGARGVERAHRLRWGLTLWAKIDPRGRAHPARWRGTALPVLSDSPAGGNLDVRIADVTSDRLPDVILQQYPHTNHGCGPRQVFTAGRGGRVVRAFASQLCETELTGRRGLLRIEAPSHRPGDSVCCPHAWRHIARRWNGSRFVTVRDRLVAVG